MFSPRFIFFILWGVQVLLHVGFHKIFFEFDAVTWFAIFFGILSFNAGTLFVTCFPGLQSSSLSLSLAEEQFFDMDRYFYVFISVYSIAAIYAIHSIYGLMISGGLEEFSAPLIREFVVDDFSGDRVLYGFFKILYLGVGFSIFFLAFAKSLSGRQLAMILVIGLISAVATTGRLFLLLFFTAAISLLHRGRIISTRGVVLFLLAFLSLFFVIALIFKKGGESGSVVENILWNAQVYFMSSVACFNDFVISGSQQIDGGALLPNPAREMAGIFGYYIPLRAALNPFAEVPLPCNTYTVLFPLFHDGGLWGVAAGMLFIGGFHQYLYEKYKNTNSPVWWYLYGISIYPLVMSIFEDAYFSSFGFWLLLWVPVVFYLIARKIGWISVATPSIESK